MERLSVRLRTMTPAEFQRAARATALGDETHRAEALRRIYADWEERLKPIPKIDPADAPGDSSWDEYLTDAANDGIPTVDDNA